MNVDKMKWMAAVPYLFVLAMVINDISIGIYDVHFFGVNFTLTLLIPYLIFYIVNRSHEIKFIGFHTRHSMSIYLWYFILTVIYSILSVIFLFFNFAVVGVGVLSMQSLFTELQNGGIAWLTSTVGIVILLFFLPLVIVTIKALIRSMKGCIRAFKLIYPDKTPWSIHHVSFNNEDDSNEAINQAQT